MATLMIRHVADTDPARFQVVRLPDGKAADPAEAPSPVDFPVEGRPDSGLLHELRWYLEEFLEYPFPPQTDRADRVLDALRAWGRAAFDALFDARDAGHLFNEATARGYDDLAVHVASDDPTVLAWPWEALEDPEAGPIGQLCHVDRRLGHQRDPVPIAEPFPEDKVNILLVTARPYERDVRYRSIARPLVELIEDRKLPAEVHVLRPPTFDALDAALRERPRYYHLVHFDGHGGYVPGGHAPGHAFKGRAGVLVFEDDDGEPDDIAADRLSVLLREHQIPAVVLNACQSGMIDAEALDPFASVAAALLQSGIRSVVAMAYSLYVSGAQQFLPAFYDRLFATGSVAEAARGGRNAMLAHPGRICARGTFPLSDWVVPVLYQQDPYDFAFAAKAAPTDDGDKADAAADLPDQDTPYGFIGRDGPLLELERALRRRPAGILIHGLGGVGKTTLALGFVRWLTSTNGLGRGAFWFRFDEVRSAEYVFNRMGEAVFGNQFVASGDLEEKVAALANAFKKERFLIVWDNFEAVRGMPGTPIAASLGEADQGHLRTFLRKLRGGATKVLITSRAEEDWLGEERRKVAIAGLDGEERWEFCDAILRDLGIAVDQDEDFVKLMDLLGGHPLAMRVLLPRLEKESAAGLIAAIESNLAAQGAAGTEAQAKLYATLGLAEQALPDDLRPLLIPLALHERYVDGNFLGHMARQVDEAWTRDRIDTVLHALATVGLLRELPQAIFEMHPALTGFLRATCLAKTGADDRDTWARAFVDVMGSVADALAPRELHEQRGAFHYHGSNFHYALAEAERLGMDVDYRALLQALAAYAQNVRNFAEAADLFQRLADACERAGDQEGQAAAYHQLGCVAQDQRDFAAAEKWYRKSLAIKEKLGNELGAALTYHQLGVVAQEQRDFAAAEESYRKALPIFERLGIEQHAAMTYGQLGNLETERPDFAAAEKWYRKALPIFERLGIEQHAASTYHQLGRVAQEQRDFAAAEGWYRKSLDINEKLGNEHGAAMTYHQLGMAAQEQRDFAAAEGWYRKSLAINEKLGNEHAAAGTYHQLGMVAEKQRDFDAAEAWYRKSLDIKEKLGDEHGAASTYGQLGIVAGLQGRFEESGRWLIRSIAAFGRTNDPAGVERNTRNFRIFYDQAPAEVQATLEVLWAEAGLGPFQEAP